MVQDSSDNACTMNSFQQWLPKLDEPIEIPNQPPDTVMEGPYTVSEGIVMEELKNCSELQNSEENDNKIIHFEIPKPQINIART